jgi:hypothetical protein
MDERGLDEKRMQLRYAGVCRLCGADLPAKTEAVYERASRTVRCVDCSATAPGVVIAAGADVPSGFASPVIDAGSAGSSARREYERRKAKDEARIRARWGRLGGVAVTLSGERPSTTAWATGADGEEQLGAALDRLTAQGVAVLHDRRIPRSMANIDHLVVTRGGVWVVDAKRYKGRPQLRTEGGILRPRTEKLVVGRRNQTKLVDGVAKQVEIVRHVCGEVPVRGVLCFVNADWPLIGGDFSTRGVSVLWPKRLSKILLRAQDLGVDVPAVHAALASTFKPA